MSTPYRRCTTRECENSIEVCEACAVRNTAIHLGCLMCSACLAEGEHQSRRPAHTSRAAWEQGITGDTWKET